MNTITLALIVFCGHPFYGVNISKTETGKIVASIGDGYSTITAPCEQVSPSTLICRGTYRMSPVSEIVYYDLKAVLKDGRYSVRVDRSDSSGPMIFNEDQCQ